MDFIGNAIKCYYGDFFNDKDAQPIEPKLMDCRRNEDLCASNYAQTDITFIKFSSVIPAGSWFKGCFKKSDIPEMILKEFGNGVSDGCIERKQYVKVCNINP